MGFWRYMSADVERNGAARRQRAALTAPPEARAELLRDLEEIDERYLRRCRRLDRVGTTAVVACVLAPSAVVLIVAAVMP